MFNAFVPPLSALTIIMVDWLRQITTPATTSAEIFAGDVMNWVIQYHDDIDLASADPQGIASIATETRFTSGKLAMWDLNKDHVIDFLTPNYAEDKSVSLPSTMPTSDHFVTEDASQEITGKSIPVNLNTLNHSTTNGAGDLLKGNGSSFQRFPRGTSLQVPRVNSGGTDVEWASLDSERVGKSVASGNGVATQFNIAHGLGSNPTYAFISVADCGSTMKAMPDYTTDSTNIVVTFGTAPESGTNNVVIYWRVVA